MTIELLERVKEHVYTYGPVRVMIHPDEATTPQRAKSEHRIIPVVVFIRDDGWTLGAPAELEEAAQRTWEGSWIGVMRAPFHKVEPI